jgi:hypothetical protein
VPAYVSKLTIAWGEPRKPREPAWDFRWRAGEPVPDGVPEEIAAAVAAVEPDLLGSDAVRARFPNLEWAYLAAGRMLGYLHLQARCYVAEEDALYTTVRLAEAAYDQLTGYEFVHWPMCPSHQHPMNAAIVDEAAWWTCPKTAEPVCPIGQL